MPEMEEKIEKKTEETRMLAKESLAYLGSKHCVLVCRGISDAPFTLKLFAKEFGVGIGALCVILTEEQRRSLNITKDIEEQLVERIREVWKAKNAVVRPGARDVIAAVSLFTNAVSEGSLTWYAPQTALNASAVTATKRPLAGGFGFGGENSLPVEACSLALWGAKTCRRDPTRKMRIG